MLGHEETLIDFESWPEYDPVLIQGATITLVIQINGKVRDSVEVLVAISEDEARKIAFEREKIKKFLGGKLPKKVIYVHGKLINFVI